MRNLSTAPAATGELPSLTGLRFLAALWVIAFHFVRPTMWGGDESGWLSAILDSGYLGVGIFFVLSGFILAYVYCSNTRRPLDRPAFWRARFARVYPLYLIAFVLAAPAWIGHRLMTDSSTAAASLKIGFSGAAYLALLQAWIPGGTHVWNSVAWTLSVEAFFYAVFPFVAFLPSRLSDRSLKAALPVLWLAAMAVPLLFWGAGGETHTGSSTLQIYLQEVPLLQLPTFLFGLLLGHLRLREEPRDSPSVVSRKSGSFVILGAAGVILTAVFSRSIPSVLLHDGLLLPFFGLLVYGLSHSRGRGVLTTPAAVLLGEASYGMYLLQYPVWWAALWLFSARPLRDYVTELHSTPALVDPRVLALSLSALMILSVLMLRYVETPARRWLRGKPKRRASEHSEGLAMMAN